MFGLWALVPVYGENCFSAAFGPLWPLGVRSVSVSVSVSGRKRGREGWEGGKC